MIRRVGSAAFAVVAVLLVCAGTNDAAGQKGTSPPAVPTVRPPPSPTTRQCQADEVFCYLQGGRAPTDKRIQLSGQAACLKKSDPMMGCGSCRPTAAVANTVDLYCDGSTPRFRSCVFGHLDADGIASNGCEVDLPPMPSTPCVRDNDCDDQLFCTGTERCQPGSSNDASGCLRGTPRCNSGQSCDETMDRCGTWCPMPDRDGDGVNSIACGGTDCDDNDVLRFPGKPETCSGADDGHDEDCDPCTVASSSMPDGDRDADGAISSRCFNQYAGVTPPACNPAQVFIDDADPRIRGVDCDDETAAVSAGAQICTPDESDVFVCATKQLTGVATSRRNTQGWRRMACPPGKKGRPGRCVVQPNGTGGCVN